MKSILRNIFGQSIEFTDENQLWKPHRQSNRFNALYSNNDGQLYVTTHDEKSPYINIDNWNEINP
ncbi:MAG: hypothetical protein NTZ67_08975, partial [Gammaproteobacteria bacterium]|nr:hypothetical protein [Gammaproteobacteria bacterium]